MIRIVLDRKTITVDKAEDLAPNLAEIFPADKRDDVLVTYVISQQPVSRRMAPTAESEG